MKKISSDDATSLAKVFVFIPLAILLVIFILTIFDYIKSGGPVSVPVGVLGIFLFLIWSSKVSVWSLADEVFDDGNKLIIKKGNE